MTTKNPAYQALIQHTIGTLSELYVQWDGLMKQGLYHEAAGISQKINAVKGLLKDCGVVAE